MSTISPVTTTPTTTTPDASQQLAGNFNTFLTLLTTQLKNQDPLSPMDSNQFTQQLVEFSSVEQQINTNDNLKSLIALGQGQANASAVSYLGKSVVLTNGEAALTNGAANWTYGLDSAAASTTLTVTNASGKVVYTGSGETTSGTHNFAWNGQDAAGNQLPDGTYTMKVNATAADGTSIGTSVASKSIVTGIDTTGSEPQLVMGTMEVPLSQASLIGSN